MSQGFVSWMFFKFLQGFFPFVYCLSSTFVKPGFVEFFGNRFIGYCVRISDKVLDGFIFPLATDSAQHLVVSSLKMQRLSSERKSSVILPRGLMSLQPHIVWCPLKSSSSIGFGGEGVTSTWGGGCYLHPLVTSFRRLNTPSTRLPWVASRIGGRRDPGG